MSDKLVELKRLLKEVLGYMPNIPLSGEVTKVDGDHCTLRLKSGLELNDVKLKATINDADSYLLMQPKIGTKAVVISLSGELDNMLLVSADEYEKIDYKQNDLEFLIDSTDKKVSIKNNQVSVHDIMSDLATLLKDFKVFTPSGPSKEVLPDTLTAIEQFETDFKKILK